MKSSELTGAALDWAVAKCEGHYLPPIDAYTDVWLSQRRFSTDWAQGGPIIEREGIWTRTTDEGEDDPDCKWRAELPYRAVEVGATPLIAAMRCYVASKLGDDVAIPEELK